MATTLASTPGARRELEHTQTQEFSHHVSPKIARFCILLVWGDPEISYLVDEQAHSLWKSETCGRPCDSEKFEKLSCCAVYMM